jgi:release factor glutamine methyltransferase
MTQSCIFSTRDHFVRCCGPGRPALRAGKVFVLNSGFTPYAASVTVLEVIQLSTDFLAKKGVDSPRLQAELLVSHVLGMPRMQLYLNFERELTSTEQDLLRELVKRRGAREPLQHITGSMSFCGLELEVNRDVLIPRAETELLAELGWGFLGELLKGDVCGHNSEAVPTRTALDFGTGSGALAIALAVHCPEARVKALDISTKALAMAKKNAARHAVVDRVDFVVGNGLSALPGAGKFDLIVTNPPYIPSTEIEQLEPEVRDYDPRSALDGGPDGLKFYRELALQAGPLLKPEGRFMTEFGDGQESGVAELFEQQNWIVERVVKDYTQRPRILIARTKTSAAGLRQTIHG